MTSMPIPKNKHLHASAYDYQLIATCYHEAGHVVGGMFNYINVKAASIVMSGPIAGTMNSAYYDPIEVSSANVRNALITARLCTLSAGPAAEKVYYNELCGLEKLPKQLSEGGKHDVITFNAIVKKFKLASNAAERKKIKDLIDRRVEKVLRTYWSDVKSIAHILYRDLNIEQEEIYASLLDGANHSFWSERVDSIKDLYKVAA